MIVSDTAIPFFLSCFPFSFFLLLLLFFPVLIVLAAVIVVVAGGGVVVVTETVDFHANCLDLENLKQR